METDRDSVETDGKARFDAVVLFIVRRNYMRGLLVAFAWVFIFVVPVHVFGLPASVLQLFMFVAFIFWVCMAEGKIVSKKGDS